LEEVINIGIKLLHCLLLISFRHILITSRVYKIAPCLHVLIVLHKEPHYYVSIPPWIALKAAVLFLPGLIHRKFRRGPRFWSWFMVEEVIEWVRREVPGRDLPHVCRLDKLNASHGSKVVDSGRGYVMRSEHKIARISQSCKIRLEDNRHLLWGYERRHLEWDVC
jgi:hypothetical protein